LNELEGRTAKKFIRKAILKPKYFYQREKWRKAKRGRGGKERIVKDFPVLIPLSGL
jgi:hypothetical protein